MIRPTAATLLFGTVVLAGDFADARRGFIAAVLTNPFAGRYEADILPMMEALNAVGTQMAHQLLQAMAVQRCELNGESVSRANGHTTAGKSGVMPARGTCVTCSDEEIENAIHYMIDKL